MTLSRPKSCSQSCLQYRSAFEGIRSSDIRKQRLQVVRCTHINKATVTQTVATAVPAFKRSCPGEGGSTAMQRRKKTCRLPGVVFSATDGLMSLALTPERAGLDGEIAL